MADDGNDVSEIDGPATSVDTENGTHAEPARPRNKARPDLPASVRDCVVKHLLKP